jgi:iron complex transport system ATP-binding protein
MLKFNDVSFSYNKKKTKVLDNLTMSFPYGFNVILGPNGAGKSTILKCIMGLLKYEGDIILNGRNTDSLSQKELVEQVVYLPQMDINATSLTVFEMVLLGRLSELGRKVSQKDIDAVISTLEMLKIKDLSLEKVCHLSGGQQKLVYVAQTIVRKPKLILMDEPMNSLDLKKQMELSQLLKNFSKEKEINLLIVLHDLNLAARYADYCAVITNFGELYNSGPINDVYTSDMLEDVYGVMAEISNDKFNRPLISLIESV